jgi:hypothetical protein
LRLFGGHLSVDHAGRIEHGGLAAADEQPEEPVSEKLADSLRGRGTVDLQRKGERRLILASRPLLPCHEPRETTEPAQSGSVCSMAVTAGPDGTRLLAKMTRVFWMPRPRCGCGIELTGG